MGAKEAPGQLVALQGTEQQQASQGGVLLAQLQVGAGDPDKNFFQRQVLGKVLGEDVAPAGLLALMLDYRPVQLFLGGKMAEDDGFVDLGAFRDFPRGSALKTLAGKELRRRMQNLLAAIVGTEPRARCFVTSSYHVSVHLLWRKSATLSRKVAAARRLR